MKKKKVLFFIFKKQQNYNINNINKFSIFNIISIHNGQNLVKKIYHLNKKIFPYYILILIYNQNIIKYIY